LSDQLLTSTYKHIYDHFINSFDTTDRFVIIGYSYRDIHINEIIKNAVDNCNFLIYNVNPNVRFPFRRNYTNENIINFSTITELKKLLSPQTIATKG